MRYFLFIAAALCFSITQAQSGSGFGIKAGLNYNTNGDYIQSITANAENPSGNIGYHIGVFGKLGNKFFFKPELVYTKTKSDYNSNDFNMQKIDAPLLVGTKLLGPVTVFGGPTLQYIIDTEFGNITVDDIKNDFSVGFNFGVGINLNNIGVDIRYERGFSSNEAVFLSNNNVDVSRLDTRPSQLILSVSLML